MNPDQILAELKHERDRIDTAIAALGGLAEPRGAGRGRGRRRSHRLSAAARARIAAAQRARWAKLKRQQKAA